MYSDILMLQKDKKWRYYMHTKIIIETFYSRDDVNKLYVSRKEGGSELASVDASIQWLEDYVKCLGEDWLQLLEIIYTTQALTEQI